MRTAITEITKDLVLFLSWLAVGITKMHRFEMYMYFLSLWCLRILQMLHCHCETILQGHFLFALV